MTEDLEERLEPTTGTFFCSLDSLARAESLTGTAPRAGVWLLLEYNGAWGEKAFPESDLPEAVKEHLNAGLETLTGSRLLLIKSRPGILAPGLRFYFAVAREHDPRLYAFDLAGYEDLLGLDFSEILAGSPAYARHLQSGPLFLVCTNGRRDACCAKYGLPVYMELLKSVEETPENQQVWQSTHVGGHRFAPNLGLFPHGLFYGRVEAQDAPALVEAYRQGEMRLEGLRGRSTYPEHVQAAEVFLRRETGEAGVSAYRLVDVAAEGPDLWRVGFQENLSGRRHTVRVRLQRYEQEVYVSCRRDKTEPLTGYRLVSYREE